LRVWWPSVISFSQNFHENLLTGSVMYKNGCTRHA